MPWEKQFDSDEVLGKAMQAFWAKGYEATSMQDLVACMGINRGSLYATFGDKRSLFLQALRRYDRLHRVDWVEGLCAGKAPRAAILAVFEGAIDTALRDGSRDGCLLVNTAQELSPHDPEVAAIVETALAGMEAFFRDKVRAGKETGEIPERVDPAQAGRALLGLLVGLRVLSRSRPEPALLRALRRQAEEVVS